MLKQLTSLDEPAAEHIANDPVRGHIPAIDRISNNKEVYYWEKDGEVAAMVCVAHCSYVPEDEDEINNEGTDYAILYTIWSYSHFAGRRLALSLVDHFRQKGIAKGVYTLSPKTDTARRFHMANRATLYRENENTYNFYYRL
jgi:hypothetical protein